jgi:hypothetical protein
MFKTLSGKKFLDFLYGKKRIHREMNGKQGIMPGKIQA